MATDALRTAYASAPAGVDIWPTLELDHPLWPQPYYLTSAPAAFTATLESGATVTFLSFPFVVILPTIDGAGQQDLKVTFTNADQAVSDAVQVAHADPTQRITCIYREYLSTSDATRTQGAAVAAAAPRVRPDPDHRRGRDRRRRPLGPRSIGASPVSGTTSRTSRGSIDECPCRPCLAARTSAPDLIGRPYAYGARGPEAFDCWGLVLELRRRLGLPLPPDPTTRGLAPAAARALFHDERPAEWVNGPPSHGCIAYAGGAAHAGVALFGRVVHAHARAGVVGLVARALVGGLR